MHANRLKTKLNIQLMRKIFLILRNPTDNKNLSTINIQQVYNYTRVSRYLF